MSRIYHIVSRAAWEQSAPGSYRADSLASEGFIHCSNADQVAWVANAFYRDQADLVVLVIEPAKLSSAVRHEDVGGGQRFPHVYGPIDRVAVVDVRPLQRGADGAWRFDA